MKEVAEAALEAGRVAGATYADVRVIDSSSEELEVRNGRVGNLQQRTSLGYGIRVLAGGSWGFASSDQVKPDHVRRTARLAVATARASAAARRKAIRLVSEPQHRDVWQTPFVKDPFRVPRERKLDLLHRIDERLRAVRGVRVAESWMGFRKKRQLFASTEGTSIEQTIVRSGVGYRATAVGRGDYQVRSYPLWTGQYMTRGYEMIEGLPLLENADRIAREAVALLQAPACPARETTLILDGSQLALQVHESCGHPIELDRVLGAEAAFMGTSFLTPEKKGRFRYGSRIVNITADTTTPGGLGTFGYDDEGVACQRWEIVRNGVFVGYLTSRETARAVGETRSHGTMRADGWNRIPLIRMVNVSLDPGEVGFEDLIADTTDGIYMIGTRSWSIDQRRLNFQFGCEIGWEIKRGRLTRMVKNPTYQGITPRFWRSCDAICDGRSWELWGLPNCGKGQPMQSAEVSHGASPARFRKVRVGIR
jgi:TldD protein